MSRGGYFGVFAFVCVNGGVLGSFGANCRVSNVFFGFIFWLRERFGTLREVMAIWRAAIGRLNRSSEHHRV